MVVAASQISVHSTVKGPEEGRKPAANPHLDLIRYCQYLNGDGKHTSGCAQRHDLAKLSRQAIEGNTLSERVGAAREFLQLNPDYALPYIVLAREGSSNEIETEAHYLKALELCRREYDRYWQKEDKQEQPSDGDSPYFLEDEAHCIIACEVARFFWRTGKTEQALEAILASVQAFCDCDEENPIYTAAGWLTQLDRDQEALNLLDGSPSSAAEWFYEKALLAFRSIGDTPVSRSFLHLAMTNNMIIRRMLLGASFEEGGADEAYEYEEVQKFVDDTKCAWHRSPGAQEWLSKRAGINHFSSSGDENEEPSVDPARLKRWANHCDLARKFIARGDSKEAKRYFKMALKEAEQLGLGTLELRQTIGYMIEIIKKRGDSTDEIAEVLERQVATFEEECTDERALLFNLQGCANQFVEIEMDERAGDLLQRVLSLMEKLIGQGDELLSQLAISRTTANLATCLMEQRRHAEAEPLLLKALAVEEELLGKNHPGLRYLQNLVTSCLRALNKGQGRKYFCEDCGKAHDSINKHEVS